MEITTKIYAVTVQFNNGDDIIAKEILCDKQGGQLPHEFAPYIPKVGERFSWGKIVHVSTPFLVRTVVDRIPESAFISEGTDERTKTTELYVYIIIKSIKSVNKNCNFTILLVPLPSNKRQVHYEIII